MWHVEVEDVVEHRVLQWVVLHNGRTPTRVGPDGKSRTVRRWTRGVRPSWRTLPSDSGVRRWQEKDVRCVFLDRLKVVRYRTHVSGPVLGTRWSGGAGDGRRFGHRVSH